MRFEQRHNLYEQPNRAEGECFPEAGTPLEKLWTMLRREEAPREREPSRLLQTIKTFATWGRGLFEFVKMIDGGSDLKSALARGIDKASATRQAIEKFEDAVDDLWFLETTEGREREAENAPTREERERMLGELETLRQSRECAMAREKKRREAINALVNIPRELLK